MNSDLQENEMIYLENILCSFSLSYVELLKNKNFGRSWLLKEFNQWAENDSNSRFCILKAGDGFGKTAFVTAQLLDKNEYVVGVHYCKYFDRERSDPKKFLLYLSYCLSKKFDEYRSILYSFLTSTVYNINNQNDLIEQDIEKLIALLIKKPFEKWKYNKPIVFVVDAINTSYYDEECGESELVNMLCENISNIPFNIKIFFTDRLSNDLENDLYQFNPKIINNFADENNNDIFEYIKNNIIDKSQLNDNITNEIVKKCEGSFSYAEKIIEQINKEKLCIDKYNEFPIGMSGIYEEEFNKLFKDTTKYSANIKPVLEIIISSKEPKSPKNIAEILNWKIEEIYTVAKKIKEYFPIFKDQILRIDLFVPTNKRAGEWLISLESGVYQISKQNGETNIVKYYLNLIRNKEYDEYSLKHLIDHLLLIKKKTELIEILNNLEYFKKRINLLGLDTVMRQYFNEIKHFSLFDQSGVNTVLSGEVIRYVLGHYRTFLYNSGLYWQLKNCGFDNVEKEIIDCFWCNKSKIGWANYLYITEDYQQAQKYILELIKNKIENTSYDDCIHSKNDGGCQNKIETNDIAGLHNTLALCYRKIVDFSLSLIHFNKANEITNIEYPLDLYEKSIAVVNIGKIDYHYLNWNAALNNSNKAIELLTKCRDINKKDINKYIELELFIAEYNRLAAEAIIWNLQIQEAYDYLDIANNIYLNYQIRDRYYIRYKYTAGFCKIMSNEEDNINTGIQILNDAKRFANSRYDKSQIFFYLAIGYYFKEENDNARISLQSAISFAIEIDARIEHCEMITLKNLLNNQNEILPYSNNKDIKNWCEHVKKIFMQRKEIFNVKHI